MSADYDVVIIGAGVHGAGCAQAAAAAGFSALVLEQTGVAAGTSSRSSKLIHGGLRYLESGQWRLVRESLRERELLLRNAPGLVRRIAFYIPIYRRTSRRPWKVRAGLTLYALLGGLAHSCRFHTVARAHWARLDGLRQDGLQAVFRYDDAQTDDAALTAAVMASARRLGAELLCPARFDGAERETGAYRVRYLRDGAAQVCRARALINAAGPWANAVLDRITPPPARLSVDLVQGAHIVCEGGPGEGIYYVEAPRDRRAVFVMPWNGATLVGTTETPYAGDPAAARPYPEEIEYLRETVEYYFPGRGRVIRDAFAGLRVLPQSPGRLFDRPRDTRLRFERPTGPGLVTVYGGKLTAYRATAAKVIARLAPGLPARARRADTARLALQA